MMSDWWTYRPEDFLLFSPRTYWRTFELHNEALWPLHILTVAAGLAMVLLILRQPQQGRWIGVLLASLWVFVAWSFLWNRYAAINWLIVYLAPAFALQAFGILVTAFPPGGLTIQRRGVAGWIGLLLAVAGLMFYPLLPFLTGRPWTSAEVFGIAPDPTAIVTLGLLLAAHGRARPFLLVIPLFWCLFSGLTLWTMDDRWFWLPILAAVAVFVALGLRRLTRRPAS